jgi:glycosyltransferase involved in cell wall biosynthesis
MKNSSRFLVALLGARCHYAIPLLLHRAGMLETLHVDICSRDWPARMHRFLPLPASVKTLAKRLNERRIPEISNNDIVSYPVFGLTRALRHAFRKTPGSVLQGYVADNRKFCRKVCQQPWGKANAVFGFNGAALEIFRRAKNSGLLTVLEQTIAPYAFVEPLLERERQIWEGWECKSSLADQWKPLAERETHEWELADIVLCGSEFVAQCLRGLGATDCQIEVVPYGIDSSIPGSLREFNGKRPLRVLFAGTLELRKGIQYFMQVAEDMPKESVQFRAVGPLRLKNIAINRLQRNVELIGAVPRSEIVQHMNWADVFVLPTLAEGSALVVYEALAAGLPVITTPNAGSVVRENSDGFIVPIRDSKAIGLKIEEYLNYPSLVSRHSRFALERASQFTVEKYGERLSSVFQQMS